MNYAAAKTFVGLLFLLISADSFDSNKDPAVLSPGQDYHVRVGIGQAALVKFSCLGGPADIVVTLRSLAERSDPLLFLSVDPDFPPSFGGHDSSTFTHWLEDSVGNHYATAKGLGPEGGILRLLNMRKFASEELNAVLTLHCSYLIAFDLLFWEHLRSRSICPLGQSLVAGRQMDRPQDVLEFCSGFGSCDKHGECQCDSKHAGPACEHDKIDILHNDGFRFQVSPGHYQYFRVHVPPHFPGGYVKVDVSGSTPLVVLVRYDDLPTKASYDLSNFDDWINRRSRTVLKFKVEALGGIGGPSSEGRPVFDSPQEPLDLGGPPPAVAGMAPEAELQAGPAPRRLQESCPQAPKLTHPSCSTPHFLHCEDVCMKCLQCAESEDKQSCGSSCQDCSQPACSRTLAACASDISCSGPEAQECEVGCGSCMSCLGGTDERCKLCSCCSGCLPLTAKCMYNGASETRYVFVGVLHHRRHKIVRGDISASADISLVEDASYTSSDESWTARLYNPFQDLRSVEMTHSQEYPSGEQFMYTMEIRQSTVANLQVRTFKDRMTLLHLVNIHHLQKMQLDFVSGSSITHVLASSKASPKTLFDFDQAPVQVDGGVRIDAQDQGDVWCAIFGHDDGSAQITVKSGGEPDGAVVSSSSIAVMAVVLVALGVYCTRGGSSLSSGLTNLAGRLGQERATSQATEPLQGYSGSDVIDRTVEDQYLHRGGLGDEGL